MKNNLIVKQHDLTDCGPACLLSIIKYYGGYVPIEILRRNSKTDKIGTSAYDLISCVRKYGLEGSGIRVKDISDINNYQLPCIAHLKMQNGLNHFVVIYKIISNKIILMDPKKGKTRLSHDEFNKIFNKIIITFKPYMKVEKINKPKSIRKTIFNIVLNNKLNSLLLIITAILIIIISLFLSYYLKIGEIFIKKDFGLTYIYKLFAIFLVLYLLKNIINHVKNYLIIKFNQNISIKLYSDFSKNIFCLPLNYIKSRTSGEVISRFNELSEINSLLPNIILSIFLDLIMAFITFNFTVRISLNLSVIVAIFMLFYFIIAYVFKNPTLRRINQNLDINAEFNSKVIETVANLRSIKNLNNDENMERRLNKHLKDAISNNCKLDNYYNNISFLKNTFYDMMIFTISSYGLYLIYLNKLVIVDLFTFLIIISYFAEPIKDLVDMITKFCFIKTSMIKIDEFSISNDIDSAKNEFEAGDINIMDLSYAYNGIDYIIKNYSCLIKEKSKVLVQGSSGSGKSTLCQLISKQLNNYSGKILINNCDLNEIKNDSIRKNITYIGQKDSLIIDTIENNIKYERNVNDKEFNIICSICEIDKIVNNKNHCLNSYISESSDNISGGEKQRITLARGLINSGKILILDESLSEVNKDMEERILKRIFNYFKDKTIIYVSHKKYSNLFDTTINV